MSTRIRAARNISGFSLPPGATAEERAGVENVLKQAFDGLGGELAGRLNHICIRTYMFIRTHTHTHISPTPIPGKYYELGSLTEEQTNFLLDRGFLFQIPTSRNLLTGAGAARSWPDNRGVYG